VYGFHSFLFLCLLCRLESLTWNLCVNHGYDVSINSTGLVVRRPDIHRRVILLLLLPFTIVKDMYFPTNFITRALEAHA
jgi:hypothetical protein